MRPCQSLPLWLEHASIIATVCYKAHQNAISTNCSVYKTPWLVQLHATGASEHITPVLKKLHWLPITVRIHYKIALLAYKVMSTQQPAYLAGLVRRYQPTRTLRPSSRRVLHSDTPRPMFASRAFCFAAPKIWNKLPKTLSENQLTLPNFKRDLKTFLFQQYSLNWTRDRSALRFFFSWQYLLFIVDIMARYQPSNNNNNNNKCFHTTSLFQWGANAPSDIYLFHLFRYLAEIFNIISRLYYALQNDVILSLLWHGVMTWRHDVKISWRQSSNSCFEKHNYAR